MRLNSSEFSYKVRWNGSVQFLFCLEYCRCFSMRSDDDGVTWTKPFEITSTFDKFRPEYDWKVLATGPGHGIQLRTGRLVVPVWLSLGTGGHAHRPSVTSVIYSDDNGKDKLAGPLDGRSDFGARREAFQVAGCDALVIHPTKLIIVPGKGHQVDPAFFESQAMLDFMFKHGLEHGVVK